jgi:hypothetical protein
VSDADRIAGGLAGLIEGLRDDVREDIREVRAEIAASEGRVTERIVRVSTDQADTRELIESFAVEHGKLHEGETAERRKVHGEFYDFIRKAELDQARRDGALGIVRWSIELMSKNATRIVAILLTIAATLGVASGSIDINIGR